MEAIREIIESAWENRDLLKEQKTIDTIRNVVDLLDKGELRVAEPTTDGWQVNEWVKKAVVLYFPIQKMETLEAGIFEYHDKIPLKRNYKERGIRVVPNAVARHGAYISEGTILMPRYNVNMTTAVKIIATLLDKISIVSIMRLLCVSGAIHAEKSWHG